MKIKQINIRNFRKLKNVKIEFNDKQTLFVGANNSGKTSAMDALRKFLVRGQGSNFLFNDITATNRKLINLLGEKWQSGVSVQEMSEWENILPSMDIWLEVEKNELHYVSAIIPTLQWNGGMLGVRLSYLPKDIENLISDYNEVYTNARKTEKSDKSSTVLLPPQNLSMFIEKNLSTYFGLEAFILDPSKIDKGQATDFENACQNTNPLDGLIRIDMISAHRGLADVDSDNDSVSLSPQLRSYYDRHLDVEKETKPEDLNTLLSLQNAQKVFNENLTKKFEDSFKELETLGFPNLTDPKIIIESKLDERKAFEHESAVQYSLSSEDATLKLPEKYNGLGYRNLISIAFRLMSFRDARLKVGKANTETRDEKIAPLHLVLLEEPEAHLHVQVQQVLIKKAYEILTKKTPKESGLTAQLVISTHSSHISNEVDFSNVRYFKRSDGIEVINLTNVFGKDKKTEKFVERYIRLSHCDLFFADAVIFVEGTSESILVPHFIRENYENLNSRYITILTVGGSHSHRFEPLTDLLGLPVLVLADLDPVDTTTAPNKKIQPVRSKDNIQTGNSAIGWWGIKEKKLDELFALQIDKKAIQSGNVFVAFQTPVNVSIKDGESFEAVPITFEDALAYENFTEIAGVLKSTGLMAKVSAAAKKTTGVEVVKDVYDAVTNSSVDKVEFSLELMYLIDKIKVPQYIKEGLNWLEQKLAKQGTPIFEVANATKQ